MIRPKSVLMLSLNKLNDIMIGNHEYTDYLYSPDAKINFDIEPYRTETYAIGLLHRGTLEVSRDLVTSNIEGPALICMGPSVIRQWKQSDNHHLMEVIFFKKDFLLPISIDVNFIDRFAFFENSSLYHSTLSEEQIGVVKQIFKFIEFNNTRLYVHKAEIIRALIYQLLFEIEPLYSSIKSMSSMTLVHKGNIIKKFKLLLAQTIKENRTVQYYAGELNVSAKYLSQLLKDKTGKTANDWINDMLTLEARVLLHDSTIRIHQISEMLNFPDQSTFGKYFKHHIGTSPLHYRQSLGLAIN